MLLLSVSAASAWAATPYYLGDPPNGYGPFDYTSVDAPRLLREVEPYHMTPRVVNLQSGETSSVGGDLTFTIRAFPNHHRALDLIAQLFRMKDNKMSPLQYDDRYRNMPESATADVYFERAMDFAPHDAIVRIIYGRHLHLIGDIDNALKYYLQGKEMNAISADLEYNLGLIYANQREYDKAINHARRAYELGHPLPGLRKKLARAGVWPKQ